MHYFKTKGERSLKPLIGVVTYNVMMHEARYTHSTGIYDNEMRRNVRNPLSLDAPCEGYDDSESTLYDIVKDDSPLVEDYVVYSVLYDSLPDKTIEGIFYKEGNSYMKLTYKRILKDILDGYKTSSIKVNVFRLTKSGEYIPFKGLSSLVKRMKLEFQEFLLKEYGFSKEDYVSGCRVL